MFYGEYLRGLGAALAIVKERSRRGAPQLFTRACHPSRMTQPARRVDRFERRTEWPLAVLALVFLVAYAAPILHPDMSSFWRQLCRVTDYAIWVVFVLEFITRVVLAERHVHYAARHVADVLMVALPVLRPLRLLRFLVLLRMINRRATASLHGRVAVYVVTSAGLVLLISALAMLETERHNPQANIKTFGDALWWAVTTMSTVGYGDRFPTTGEGRYIGTGLMLAGVALLGVVTATLASWLIAQVRKVESEAETATRRDIDELRADIARLTQALQQREADDSAS
jgi:voltage-gated potassium channel